MGKKKEKKFRDFNLVYKGLNKVRRYYVEKLIDLGYSEDKIKLMLTPLLDDDLEILYDAIKLNAPYDKLNLAINANPKFLYSMAKLINMGVSDYFIDKLLTVRFITHPNNEFEYLIYTFDKLYDNVQKVHRVNLFNLLIKNKIDNPDLWIIYNKLNTFYNLDEIESMMNGYNQEQLESIYNKSAKCRVKIDGYRIFKYLSPSFETCKFQLILDMLTYNSSDSVLNQVKKDEVCCKYNELLKSFMINGGTVTDAFLTFVRGMSKLDSYNKFHEEIDMLGTFTELGRTIAKYQLVYPNKEEFRTNMAIFYTVFTNFKHISSTLINLTHRLIKLNLLESPLKDYLFNMYKETGKPNILFKIIVDYREKYNVDMILLRLNDILLEYDDGYISLLLYSKIDMSTYLFTEIISAVNMGLSIDALKKILTLIENKTITENNIRVKIMDLLDNN